MANNLKKLRERAGISEKELAEMVGATQLQVQRIESNKYPARIDLALALSAALGKPINAVFPGAAKALAALDEELARPMHVSREMYAKLREVGLEGDTRQHSLKVLLRGHRNPIFFSFPAKELTRLFRAIQDEAAGEAERSFIVFNSDALRVAINLKALIFCHFLWEAGFVIVDAATEIDRGEDGPLQSVQAFFGEDETPTVIGAEAEDDTGIENENNYLAEIFFQLDTGGIGPHQRLHIVDEDGESALLRVRDITLLTAPLWVLDPDERVPDEDVENES